MRRYGILILMAIALMTGSCDFFRGLAGRPTSADLEVKRKELAAAEAEKAHLQRIEALKEKERRMADSLAALEQHLLDSLSQTKGTLLNSSKLGGMYTTKLSCKYYVVVGAFRNRSYAERKFKNCNKAGYTATIIQFRNGLSAVAICPTDQLSEALKSLKAAKKNGVAPHDGWILVNN